MRKETIKQLCVALRQLPRGTAPEWSDETTQFYTTALADLPDALLRKAASYVLTHCKFRPTPAEIRDIAKQITTADQPDPGAALAEVRNLIRRYGLNGRQVIAEFYCEIKTRKVIFKPTGAFLPGPPTFSSPEIAKTVEALGGWEEVNGYAPSMFTAHFQQLYKAIVGGAGDEDLKALRLEYREQSQGMLEAQRMVDEEPVPREQRRLPENDTERKVMSIAGALVKAMPGGG